MTPREKQVPIRVAVVAGATRGAGRGIARALGETGAVVYCTGRSTRDRPSAYGRPETIEETAELVTALGRSGVAVRVDHSQEDEVRGLFARVEREHGALDVLVNCVAGEDPTFEWNRPFYETRLEQAEGLMRQAFFSHVITAKHAAPLMIRARRGLIVEVTDRDTTGYGGMGFLHDLVKGSVMRLAMAMAEELRPKGVAAVSVTPGFLRSEAMLAHFGVTEANWRDGGKKDPNFLESESPLFVGRAIAALARDPAVMDWSGEAVSSWELGAHYDVVDYDGRRPDWIRCISGYVASQPGFRRQFERGIAQQERALERARRYLGSPAGDALGRPQPRARRGRAAPRA
jgi:NAD(P)-dependent dehydrogenase (short-subunit alcohol dehydrogenase family)